MTPDGQRTMSTFLGACQDLTEADVDEELVSQSAVTYLEGYLWDPPAAKAAFVKASKIARAAGREVALSLSDSFCVDRYRDEFLGLMRSGAVQIVFANESELHSLYQTADFETALAQLRAENILGVVTRSEQGSVVVKGAEVLTAPAFPVEERRRHHGRGRPLRGRFSRRLHEGARSFELREARRAGRGRDHPAHRRAAAEGSGAAC